jgi:polyisoprenyl-teichoic acid--peptidoglycan teichoic acid transferase
MSDRPRRPAPSSRNNSSKPSLRNQLLLVFGILGLAVGAFYTALVVATQIDHIFFPDNELRIGGGLGRLPGIDSGNSGEIGGRRINVLVMGLDKRAGDGDLPSRTDTMFVMTIDPSTRSARGLAMPRDLWVDIPTPQGTVQERINAAYVLGEARNYPGGGIGTVRRTVENLLGLKIDYHVMIDFEGFKEVVNLLGGIDVDIPEGLEVDDPYYSETERLGDYYPCVFDAGFYHMDGSQALCVARVRRNSSDLERILRQQLIIYAMISKASSLDVLTSPQNVSSLWKNYKNTISTDINDLLVPGFARLAASIDQESMAFLSLGAATSPYTIPSTGAQVLMPSPAGVRQIVEAFLSDNRLQQEAATVEVQNGSGQDGQAALAIDYFTSLGIPRELMSPGNAATLHPQTEIIVYSGKRYTAERLASWLEVPRDRVRSATQADMALRTYTADILVILGSDAKIDSVASVPSPAR